VWEGENSGVKVALLGLILRHGREQKDKRGNKTFGDVLLVGKLGQGEKEAQTRSVLGGSPLIAGSLME